MIKFKKLSINCINEDMLKCAIKKGYKIPSVSIKQHFGKKAEFFINYVNGIIKDYEFIVIDKNGKSEAIYLIA